MYSLRQQTEYILDSASYDAGEFRTSDGRIPPFGITIDDEGKIKTFSFPKDATPASVLRAERTKRTTAVAIVEAEGADVLAIRIDFRDGDPIFVRAPFRLKRRFLRRPEIDLASMDEIRTHPGVRIVFGEPAERPI